MALAAFPFNRLPAELRLEIWSFAIRADARRRRVVEQNLQVFPTLDLAASPFLSVNIESREAARAFYPVRLEVYYRRLPECEAQGQEQEQEQQRPEAEAEGEGQTHTQPQPQTQQQPLPLLQLQPADYRGLVYLSPALDDMVSVYRRAALYESELALERSERSRMTAWRHGTRPMSEETRWLFRRYPDRWCLTRYASAYLDTRDWLEVHEWMLTFGEEGYRGARRLLRSMRINTPGFANVFGWDDG
ncbi:hypothetical protein F5Y14DRAFT_82461 [Nemania sp. NC0429]|nr:hypothetical protein F5Y14DRAFT_82461 [Nemania sp. NC0429]